MKFLLAYALILLASLFLPYMVEKTACEVSTESRAIADELSTFEARIVKVSEGNCQVSSRVILGTGKVSYYSDWFEGRKMANGQVFHQASRSIAHRSLPFNTIVFMAGVNGQSPSVSPSPASNSLLTSSQIGIRPRTVGFIRDRGPFHFDMFRQYDRDFDITYLMGRELGIIEQGVATVEWGAILPEGRE